VNPPTCFSDKANLQGDVDTNEYIILINKIRMYSTTDCKMYKIAINIVMWIVWLVRFKQVLGQISYAIVYNVVVCIDI